MPILLVHALHDDVIDNREFEDLGQVAIDSGNSDVSQLYLESGHTFDGKHSELGRVIVEWLKERS